jgi:hypothetical protein
MTTHHIYLLMKESRDSSLFSPRHSMRIRWGPSANPVASKSVARAVSGPPPFQVSTVAEPRAADFCRHLPHQATRGRALLLGFLLANMSHQFLGGTAGCQL